MKTKSLFRRTFIGIVLFFLYAPIIVLITFSFNSSKSRSIWEGFTLDWYIELFKDTTILNSLYITLVVAVVSALIATVIGTAAAIGIGNFKKFPKGLILSVNQIPILNPDIVTGVSLMLLFVFLSIDLGVVTLIIAHITFNIPYVILSVMPKLRQLNVNLYDAALDLGANPIQAFFKVIMPEIMPGIVTGMLLAFTLSIDDFVISYFTSGSTAQTLAITIYSMTRKRVSPKINAVSTLLFLGVLILLIIVNIRQANSDKKKKKLDESSDY